VWLILGGLILLIAWVVVDLLVKTQLAVKPQAPVSAVGEHPNTPVLPDRAEKIPQIPHQTILKIQDQVRRSVDALMQRPRPSDEERPKNGTSYKVGRPLLLFK